jgi:predicted RNase H-like nuclease (RuvC/YqgF family)
MLARPFEYANNHERDAPAAAISVYRRYKNKFDQIKKKIPYGIQTDEVIARVVRGETVESSIGEMTRVEMERPEKIEELKPESRSEAQELREIVRKQEEQINSLKKYLDELKAIIKSREETIQQQEHQIAKLKTGAYREIKGDREIQIRDKELHRLKKELLEKDIHLAKLRDHVERLKQLRRLEVSGRGLPVKIVEAFARDSILKTSELYGIKKGDIVLLEDASGGGPSTVELLASKGVKAVIALSEMSHIAEEEFFKANIPVFNGNEIPVERVEDYAVLDPDLFKKALEVWNKKAEEKRKRSREEWLQSLVEEYRTERRREQRADDNP